MDVDAGAVGGKRPARIAGGGGVAKKQVHRLCEKFSHTPAIYLNLLYLLSHVLCT